ncbi:hypothetical protein APUTEX25_005197 [Auxenochlorella protothecoides]|uniref:E3 ubiquitin-protein ligase synoviolin-like TPR repeats domain-containing protein n=1 Tax=Auxenochlorella protothecoides TaxID=3075 RepID=A0A3M7KRR0_AUXPR|nr:hypothetical protein APUTEX25_005197 [Auxenochlorella protothecoides]|eukprot:RMZ53208.1 hypothetical protein APUTEX25_005197 [Auxenochlorella protothecoides]
MPPELASRQAVQPWMIIMSVFLASGSGLWYQLGTIGGGAGQQSASLAADTLSRAWQEGTDPGVAFDEARARSSEVLEDVLQSQLGLFFLCSLFLSTYALGALVTKALFLGQLTILETTKLAERMLKFVMLKVVFLGAVVDPEPHELGTWLLWFSVMAFFRAFVGLARDRCEALLSSPRATPLQHARCLVLLVGILGQAGSWVASYAAAADPSRPSAALSHALLWLFDAVCVAIEAAHAVLKYGVHAVERWKAQRAEAAGADPATGWEGRGPFLYHVEVGVDLVLHALTLGHYCHLWWLHGFRLQLIDAVLFLDVRPGAGLGEGAALSANAPHTLTEQLATASFRSLSATFSTNSVAQRGASHSQHPHEQEEVASPAPSSMSCRLSGARHRYGTRSQSAAPQ